MARSCAHLLERLALGVELGHASLVCLLQAHPRISISSVPLADHAPRALQPRFQAAAGTARCDRKRPACSLSRAGQPRTSADLRRCSRANCRFLSASASTAALAAEWRRGRALGRSPVHGSDRRRQHAPSSIRRRSARRLRSACAETAPATRCSAAGSNTWSSDGRVWRR